MAMVEAQNITWNKFVSRTSAFSMHYPAGWSAVEGNVFVDMRNVSTAEEMLLAAYPPDPAKSPPEFARGVFEMLWSGTPGLTISSSTADGETATVDFSFLFQGSTMPGLAYVVKKNSIVGWLSYCAPAASFDRQRGLALLREIATTLSRGAGSLAPGIPAEPSMIIGTWVTDSPYGDVVSSAGSFQRAADTSETYWFGQDGAYRHRVIATGLLTGAPIAAGHYSVQGDLLILHMESETANGRTTPWDQILRFRWSMRDPRTLLLDNAVGTSWDTSPYTITTLHRYVDPSAR